MNKYILIAFALLFTAEAFGQISITDGRHSLEIGGGVYAYYNYRFYPDKDRADQRKNNFALRNAFIELEGRIGHNIEYELKYNFAKSSLADPENPPLMNAFATYKGLAAADVTVGYTKVPYSRSSLVPFQYMPFIQRSVLGKGDIYSRRDLGFMLSKSLLNQQLNYYLGVFSGFGEGFNSATLGGDNDPSGNPEFIARVDYAWPSRFRYREIDMNISAIPMLAIGLNGRYADKRTSFAGDYFMKTIDGEKTSVGGDIAFQYQGLSLQFEAHQLFIEPRNANSLVYNDEDPKTGAVVERNWVGKETGYRAGGFLAQANYFSKKLRSVVAVRYDNFNANDLRKFDTSENINFAYNFLVDDFNSVIRLQYMYRLRKDYVNGPTDDQFRIGWQMLFK